MCVCLIRHLWSDSNKRERRLEERIFKSICGFSAKEENKKLFRLYFCSEKMVKLRIYIVE